MFPMFGLAVTLRQNLVIGLVFTGTIFSPGDPDTEGRK